MSTARISKSTLAGRHLDVTKPIGIGLVVAAMLPVVMLPSLRGAIVTGALLTFARSIGEFGSTIMVSGNLAMKTQTAPLYIFTKYNSGDVEGANAIAVVLAIISFAIFSLIIFFRKRLER